MHITWKLLPVGFLRLILSYDPTGVDQAAEVEVLRLQRSARAELAKRGVAERKPKPGALFSRWPGVVYNPWRKP